MSIQHPIFSPWRVELLHYTENADKVIADAARVCYASKGSNDVALLDRLRKSGHMSPFEHAVFTFRLSPVSRVLLAQLTRHRLASYSVESQRYVEYSDEAKYYVPPSIAQVGAGSLRFCDQLQQIHEWYKEWLKEVPAEDARYILPNAMTTTVVVTMNARELLHFFRLRCCNRAQLEIRRVACGMLFYCKQVAPLTFKGAGPACLTGECPEGEHGCGRPWEGSDQCEDVVYDEPFEYLYNIQTPEPSNG